MSNKWMDLLKSRRFWAAVAALVAVVCKDTLGIPEDTVREMVLVIVAIIVGDSVRKIETERKE